EHSRNAEERGHRHDVAAKRAEQLLQTVREIQEGEDYAHGGVEKLAVPVQNGSHVLTPLMAAGSVYSGPLRSAHVSSAPHSPRSAAIGSSRAARRAGSHIAAADTNTKTKPATAKLGTSIALTWNSSPRRSCAMAAAASIPIPIPVPTSCV